MAYTVYITRPPHFSSRIRRKITHAAWEYLVKGDATLQPTDGGAVRFVPEEGCPPAHFTFEDGSILCPNPCERTIDKMAALAAALDAQVQGEDGEMYTSGADLPYLVQFALFYRISRRLRVRFPADSPRRPQLDVASCVATPIIVNAADHRVPPPEGLELANGSRLAIGRGGRRLGIGFSLGDRKPSPALQALLNPLRPVQSST